MLVEASPYDTVWGIGLAASAPRVNDPREWRGKDLLGFAMMDVREQLKDIASEMIGCDTKRL